MGLNTNMSEALHKMDAERIAISPKRCISVRNRNAKCQRCVDSCAAGALYRKGNDILVDANKCIGCGTCANACPTAAISLSHPSPAQVSKAAKASLVKHGGNPVLCCKNFVDSFAGFGCTASNSQLDSTTTNAALKSFEAANVCVLPCLGHIDEALLIELAVRAANCIHIIHGNCSMCEYVKGGKLCEQVCKEAQQLLDVFNSKCQIDYVQQLPQFVIDEIQKQSSSGNASNAANNNENNATSLFNLSSSSNENSPKENDEDCAHSGCAGKDCTNSDCTGTQGSAQYCLNDLYNKVGKNGTLSHHIPLKRTRLFNCLSHLGKPKPTDIKTRLAGRISIDTNKCMSCRMCSVFCPTGALIKKGEVKNRKEAFGLYHRPSLCMQCKCCEQICAKDAIKVDSKLSLEKFLGKKEIFIELPHPKWQANTPESMYNKFADWLGPDINTGHF